MLVREVMSGHVVNSKHRIVVYKTSHAGSPRFYVQWEGDDAGRERSKWGMSKGEKEKL